MHLKDYNIKDRVSEAVLREGLLVKNDHGSYSPKKKSNQGVYGLLTTPAVQSIYKSRTASSNRNLDEILNSRVI